MNQPLSQIRDFYAQELAYQNYQLNACAKQWSDARVASIKLLETGDSGMFDSVEIKHVDDSVPQPVKDAMARHQWLSQHCLSHVELFHIRAEQNWTYALLALGYVNDGWDGFCQLLEIFDETGELLGATKADTDQFVWLDSPFTTEAFPVGSPAEWTEDAIVDENALWSFEKAMRVDNEDGITRLVFPWAEA